MEKIEKRICKKCQKSMPKEEAMECKNCRRQFCNDHITAVLEEKNKKGECPAMCIPCYHLKYGNR